MTTKVATVSIDLNQLATVRGGADVGDAVRGTASAVGRVITTGVGSALAGAGSFILGGTAAGVIGATTGLMSKQSAYWSKPANAAVTTVAIVSGLSGAYYAGKGIWRAGKQ